MIGDGYRITAGAGGWSYVWDHDQKPHLHPVVTPAGTLLTLVEPADHPWQRGIWLVIKLVDGDNFWEEGDPAGWGTQRHLAAPERTDHTDGTVTITGDLDWLRPDGTTVAVREHRVLRHVPFDDHAYAIDWDSTIRTASGTTRPVVLDRTPWNGLWGGYSGLAFRGRDDWADTRLLLDAEPDPAVEAAEPVAAINPDGTPAPDLVGRDPASGHLDKVAAQRSRWCDLSSNDAGVCLLDHPDNPSHPVPFYASCRAGLGYGDGWANTVYPAFLWDAPQQLAPGQEMRFRYRLVVHDGAWDRDRADDAWTAWTSPSPADRRSAPGVS